MSVAAFDQIRAGFKKIQTDAQHLCKYPQQYWHDGMPIGFIVDESIKNLGFTAYFISLMSLLDDALALYLQTQHSHSEDTLHRKIAFLGSRHELSEAAALVALKNERNQYAHEPGAYATRERMLTALDTVEAELRHLRILPPSAD